ncbi:MAG: hypothetical protein LBR05_08195 [Azoarcus sp.]|jgi:hypothetical protein|nr:hypothetical protein [Azoarcus sp.]
MVEHYVIFSVRVERGETLFLRFCDERGYFALEDVEYEVNLSSLIVRNESLACLANPEVFATATVVDGGLSIRWLGDEVIKLSSDYLRALAVEQKAEATCALGNERLLEISRSLPDWLSRDRESVLRRLVERVLADCPSLDGLDADICKAVGELCDEEQLVLLLPLCNDLADLIYDNEVGNWAETLRKFSGHEWRPKLKNAVLERTGRQEESPACPAADEQALRVD